MQYVAGFLLGTAASFVTIGGHETAVAWFFIVGVLMTVADYLIRVDRREKKRRGQ